jgi:hypothetical protein
MRWRLWLPALFWALLNDGLDVLGIGAVPVIGDLFDLWCCFTMHPPVHYVDEIPVALELLPEPFLEALPFHTGVLVVSFLRHRAL